MLTRSGNKSVLFVWKVKGLRYERIARREALRSKRGVIRSREFMSGDGGVPEPERSLELAEACQAVALRSPTVGVAAVHAELSRPRERCHRQ